MPFLVAMPRLSVDLSYLRLVSSFYVATFAIRVSFGISVITFSHYVQASDFVYGLVVASSPLLEIVTIVWVGMAIDKYGRRRFLLSGLAIGLVGLYLLATTRETLPLAVLNAIHGISAGLILVSSLALLTDYASPETRGREMGVFDFVNLFGWIAGIVLGLVFLDVFRNDLAMTFLVSGTIALVGFLYAYANVREPQRDRFVSTSSGWRMFRQALSDRRIAFLLAPWFAVYVLISSAISFLPRALGGGTPTAAVA
ncbi:MAG TPA: MFS transporter, partial [Burkholderiales bacterium]|nr:MFS transporter [Burkholderiales bacterium]